MIKVPMIARLRFLWNKKFFGVLTALMIVIVAGSLYSYHPHDPSWFSGSSNHLLRNWFGLFGSYFAGLLMHIFGFGAFVIILVLGFTLYMIIAKKELRNEWERLAACIALIPLTSLVFSMYGMPFDYGLGGIIGLRFSAVLINLFDYAGSLLFVHAGILACGILLTRLSFIRVVQPVVGCAQLLGNKCIEHRVIQRTLLLAATVCYKAIYAPLQFLWTFSKKLLDGSAFDGTDLMVPEESAVDELQGLLHDDTQKSLFQPYASREQDVHAKDSPKEHVIAETAHQINIGFAQKEIAHHAPEISHTNEYVHDLADYTLPDTSVFIGVEGRQDDVAFKKGLEKQAVMLEEKLKRFGISGHVVSIKSGPVVTLFEYQPEIDTKISKILALEDDLAMALQALSIRIIAPIPGRSVVGFEVANQQRKDVLLAGVIKSQEYQKFNGQLPLVLGQDTIGREIIVDLARMPHLLIAGSTGSGKSVALNAMLMSLLCKCSPDSLRLILIDPKRLEFASYADIAHLLFPIVTDPKRSIPVMRWVVKEMERRYELMAQSGVRNIKDYQAIEGLEPLPYIVVIIDELADLMMTVGRDIEDLITRIAQMARASGIHMIVATQRPSVDVITGLIKVNFPSRVSFRVTSKVDSRTILDCVGADKLLGRGDMLFLDSTSSQLERVHGAYVSDDEILKVVEHIRSQRDVEYLDISQELAAEQSDVNDEDEQLFQQVVNFLQDVDEVSISLVQRKFRIGYNRSARIIDMLEARGLIMPTQGGKTRKVIR